MKILYRHLCNVLVIRETCKIEPMSGKFIFVSGLSGAGKSTMVRAVLDALDDVRPVVTCTTRPRRAEEIDSFEYWFATEEEYGKLKAESNNWDETIYAGYKYGTDGEMYMNYLRDGVNIIVAVAPDYSIIQSTAGKYGIDATTIWLDTSRRKSKRRIRKDPGRAERKEDPTIREKFDYIYEPVGNIGADSAAFVQLVADIISDD